MGEGFSGDSRTQNNPSIWKVNDMNSKASVRDLYSQIAGTLDHKSKTHGDPDIFASVFIDMLKAYIAGAHAHGRELEAADTHAILGTVLKGARMACGGPQAPHFYDVAGYGGLGLALVLADMEKEAPEADRGTETHEGLFTGDPGYDAKLKAIQLEEILRSDDQWSDLLEGDHHIELTARKKKPGVDDDAIIRRWEDLIAGGYGKRPMPPKRPEGDRKFMDVGLTNAAGQEQRPMASAGQPALS